MKRQNVKRKYQARRSVKKSSFRQNVIKYSLYVLFVSFVLATGYHYRNGLAYYLSFKSNKIAKQDKEAKRISDVRNFQVLQNKGTKAVGIDVSEYQGAIDWPAVNAIEEKFPIQFVFVRATVGNDRVDKAFDENWLGAKDRKIIRGAYHYYRPNENSLEQAALYIKTVRLYKGDLPPVLDIEKLPENQSVARLKIGLRRWLEAVESHYKVKPIIYTGEKYYDDFLKEEFSDYLFWIANYNFYREKMKEDWLFWQFTEKGSVPGINGNVDVNIYNGDFQQLQFITVE
ncbi:glycoside hydrolase family 25 protein [Flavobacterium sp. F-380]|uniref:Glycoside hydrolase family 25 protein n=1 Tax=Flavobacterium kayseriense TaxID=2764714 RepID=A0ABR7J7D1_9FLAO|nr:glycoside hydrolase family 25 protein [Flavobacterium kayseriense]MBC5841407.1 glycoside hydrolase family 25 protein [Flavobacterium kayseriense]MBC5847935.1 glycoside hydrolase family 25 protein [Flavobacterium kayseriense]